jgi:Fungal specific transcription factor domain
MNPEATLREQPSESGLKVPENECGFWEPRLGRSQPGAPLGESSDDPDIEAALRAYLTAVKFSILPPKAHVRALVDLYFQSIQPFLPIIDVDDFQAKSRKDSESTLLKQAVCLIASKHDSAGSHLYLGDDQVLLSHRDFGKRLYRSIEATLNARLEEDRIILIQVLSLLSMFVEGTDGAEQASMHLSLAVHHAHTIGMQFGRGNDGDKRSEYYHRLFWCLTSLDIANAAINSRPRAMHTQDERLENPTTWPETRYTPFGMWLELSAALDTAIYFYRPNVDERATGWEDGFPSFEEIIGDKGDIMEPTIVGKCN